MKNPLNTLYLRVRVLILLIFNVMIGKVFAVGETCSNAHVLNINTTNQNGEFNIVNADNSIWFTFIATENFADLYSPETSFQGGIVAEEMTAFTGYCGSLSQIETVIFTF